MSSEDEEDQKQDKMDISYAEQSYDKSTPFTIVWTALPLISWIVPVIGHTGITE